MKSRLLEFFININLDYRILHNPKQLYNGIYSDIDIVIPKSKLKDFENYLTNNKFIRPIQLIYHKNGYYFVIVYNDNKEIKIVPIDVITDYKYKNKLICLNHEYFTEETFYNELKCISEDLELKYLITKRIFKESFTEEHKKRIKELLNNDKANSVFNELFGQKWGIFVYNSLISDDWISIERKVKKLKRLVIYRLIKKHPYKYIIGHIEELKRIIYRIKNHTGLMIVVMGSDGTGKSTLISNLIPRISPAFRGIARYHLKASFSNQKKDAPPVIDPHSKKPWPFPISYIKLFYFFLTYIVGYYFKIKLKLVRSNLVVIDRYYDDIIVDKLRYRCRSSEILLRYLRKFIPKPDLYLILEAPVDVIIKRKKELKESELRSQRDGYIKLQSMVEYGKIVDASKNIDEVLGEACDIIFDLLYTRYFTQRKIISNIGDRKNFSQDSDISKYLSLKLSDGREYLIPKSSPPKLLKNFGLYNPQNIKGRLVKYFLFKLPHLKLKYFLLKTKLIESIEPSNLLIRELNQIMVRLFGEDKYYYVISCGTPGAGQKPVVQVINSKFKTLCYIKIGINEDTIKSLKNEKEILINLKKEHHLFNVPSVLFGEMVNDNYLLFIEPISEYKSFMGGINQKHIDLLIDLYNSSNYETEFNNSIFFKELYKDINLIPSVYYKNFALRILDNILKKLNNKKLKFCLNHGDFCSWNINYRDEQLYIIDWESTSYHLPVGYDFFHYVFQQVSLIKKKNIINTIKVIENYFDIDKISLYLHRIGINKDNYPTIFKLYLIHKFVYYSLRDYDVNKIHKFQTLLYQLDYLNR